jgi:hypothetical protein
MNSPPHRDQSRPLALNLLHHSVQIASADAGDPIESDPTWPFQDDLCFTALTEHVNVGRAVIVGKNHEPEAMGAVSRHHK